LHPHGIVDGPVIHRDTQDPVGRRASWYAIRSSVIPPMMSQWRLLPPPGRAPPRRLVPPRRLSSFCRCQRATEKWSPRIPELACGTRNAGSLGQRVFYPGPPKASSLLRPSIAGNPREKAPLVRRQEKGRSRGP